MGAQRHCAPDCASHPDCNVWKSFHPGTERLRPGARRHPTLADGRADPQQQEELEVFNHTFNKRSMLHRLALLALAVVSSGAWAQYSIQVLSSRSDTITGGDALVQVNVPSDPSPLSTYYVKLNNVDVTGMFLVVDSPTNQ